VSACRWLCALALACDEPRDPYIAPAVLESSSPPTCQGLTISERFEVGGAVIAVAADGPTVYAAVGTGIDVLPAPGAAPTQRLETPGEPRDLLVEGDALWVADGTGGLSRFALREDLARATWQTGGEIRRVAASAGMLWASDARGRVLALPLNADEQTEPQALALDGWPDGLAPAPHGVLVAIRQVGIAQVRATPSGLIMQPQGSTAARDIAQVGKRTFTITRSAVTSDRATLALPAEESRLEATRDGVLIASAGLGVLEWDGAAPAPTAWDLRLELQAGPEQPVQARDIEMLGPGRAVIAAGTAGVLWATRDDDGWQVSARHDVGGALHRAVAFKDGVALLRTSERGDEVLFFDGTELTRLHRSTGSLSDLAPTADGLLLSGRGLSRLDADGTHRMLAELKGAEIVGVESTPDGQAVLFSRQHGLMWFDAETGEQRAVSDVGGAYLPMDPVVLGGDVFVAYGGLGWVQRFTAPGEPGLPMVLLSGAAANLQPGAVLPTRAAAFGPDLYFAIPQVGVERIDLQTNQTRVTRFAGGAIDVQPFGDRLAAAAHRGGVVVIDPQTGAVVASCDLPGETWGVAAIGERLIAVTRGTLFTLTEAP